jgi:catechol 2,3-dioxygenase-like lactoylglutathione lyase family enzyme
MQIARLDHLVLTVADIAKTCDFYTKVLGMEVQQFGEGRTALRFGQQKINLHPADNIPGLVADKPTAGSGDLCFITETPIAEVVAHLNQCGVPIITGPGPRAGAIGTITSVYIRDPDQNLVEISNYRGLTPRFSSFVIPGLIPGIHVDGRVKPGHDEENEEVAS